MAIKGFLKRIVRAAARVGAEKKMVPIPKPIDGVHILAGKVALITGGNSGIGLAIARTFLHSGCKVIIAGTNEGKLVECCESLQEEACELGGVKSCVLNVNDVDSMPRKVREAAALFDESRIDILVNSAGIHGHLKFLEITEEEYDCVMGVNLKGTFFLCQTVGNYMIREGIKGHILNVSSSSALRPAWGPYHISKWGIRGFTIGLAKQLQPYGIVVNAIAPGPTATPMLGRKGEDSIYNGGSQAGRYLLPEEIAPLAAFMVSDLGGMIIGDTFYMTGGSGTVTLEL